MDSEDERELLKGLDCDERGIPKSWKGMEFRLFQAEERHDQVLIKAIGGRDDIMSEYLNDDFRGRHRVARFFQTTKGFHSGQLDLTGRHKPRYDSIIQRWTEFVEDMDEIRQHATPVGLEEDSMRDMFALPPEIGFSSEKAFVVDPPSLLEKFDEKWKTGVQPLTIGALLKATDSLTTFLTDNPLPIFQKLCLQDLPPEIIHHIMEFTDSICARHLGGTSRFFRDISFSHVFRDLSLGFYATTAPFPDNEDPETFIEQAIQDSRTKLLRRASFVSSHPEIPKRLRALSLINHTMDHSLLEAMNDLAYYQPIYDILQNILLQAPELRTIYISSFLISFELSRKIMAVPNLRTLRLICCHTASQPREELPPSTSIANVSLRIVDNDIWRFLPNVRGLRVLSVGSLYSPDHDGSLLAPKEFINSINPFKTLERLCIYDIMVPELYRLTNWVKKVNRDTPPALTHLKLAGTTPFDQNIVSEIIRTFGTPSMRYLVLTSVNSVVPNLFKELAKAFPNVVSLTIIYDPSSGNRNRNRLPTPWPYPIQDYASALEEFKCLKTFRWNQTIGLPMDTEDVNLANDAIADMETTAQVLGTKMNTLERIDFIERGTSILEICIKRNEKGAVSAQVEKDMNGMSYRSAYHDPNFLTGNSWALV